MSLQLIFILKWVLFTQFQRFILNHFLPGISKALSYKWNSFESLKWESVLFPFKNIETAYSALHESPALPPDSHFPAVLPWPLILWLWCCLSYNVLARDPGRVCLDMLGSIQGRGSGCRWLKPLFLMSWWSSHTECILWEPICTSATM